LPHHPKPFFRPSRNLWYVQINGKQHNLGPDEGRAFERYHELMRSARQGKPVAGDLVVAVIDAFLEWVEQNKAPRTYEWYQRHCQAFASGVPATLTVAQFKPFHLTGLLGKHPDWSPTTKNGLCRAVQRAFRWAEKEGLIHRSPLAGVEKPKARTREVLITPEEFNGLLGLVHSPEFNDLLVTSWETGARPQEVTAVEARHVDLGLGRWVFPIEESKGKKFPRVVYLNDRALAITRRLLLKHPSGPLFRNTEGEPWTRFALNCAFGRLQVALGLARMKELGVGVEPVKRFRASAHKGKGELVRARAEHQARLRGRRKEVERLARKHGKKYTLYHFRHSWATRALPRGVDPLTVAILLGHADPSMLAKVYQHLAHDPDFLRNAARKAVG
jgi:integrase